jgi:hypothetical protein
LTVRIACSPNSSVTASFAIVVSPTNTARSGANTANARK